MFRRLYDSGWRYTYNVRKWLSPSSSVLLLAKTITHPAARSLCDSWASCLSHCVLFSVIWALLPEINVMMMMMTMMMTTFLVEAKINSKRFTVQQKCPNESKSQCCDFISCFFFFVFTGLHAMQTRSSDENSVRPSVTRVHCDKTVERSVQIYIPYERTFIPLLWEEEWLVGGDPFYVKFWVNRPPLERNRRFSTNNRS